MQRKVAFILLSAVGMNLKILLTLFLIAFLITPYNVMAGTGNQLSMVLVPVHDGEQDAESDASLDFLRQNLNKNSGIKVVDPVNVKSVLSYYDRPSTEKTAETGSLLARAKENYYKMNYIEAKGLVKNVIERIKSSANGIYNDGNDLLDAYLTLGLVNRSMGNVGEARQAFLEALRLDPYYKLDSRAFSPSVINLFENVRSSAELVSKGTIKVDAKPKVTEVYLNGISKGVTPLVIKDVPAGVHYLKLSANKYSTVYKKINVDNGKTLSVREKLVWSDGQGELNGKDYITAVVSIAQIDDGLKIADLMKVDKVVLVDADKGAATVRMVDAKLRTGHKQITLPNKNGSIDTNGMADKLLTQARINIASNPEKYSEPLGKGDTNMLGAKKRSGISKPVLFGILGGVLAAGLGVGLAVGLSGGGSNSGTGSVNVSFK